MNRGRFPALVQMSIEYCSDPSPVVSLFKKKSISSKLLEKENFPKFPLDFFKLSDSLLLF